MNPRFFLIVLICAMTSTVLAQELKIIPDKNKDGKYALKNTETSAVIGGYDYDFIVDGTGVREAESGELIPYFPCRKGGEWGVLDQNGALVLPLKAMDSLWMLRSKDAFRLMYDDGRYDYVNLDGSVIATDIVEERRSPYARYRVLVKQDGTQSIIHRGKEVLKPIPYELDLQIQNLAKTFLVKNSKGYHVINLDGFPLNDEPFEAATPIDFNGNLAVKRNGKWKMLDKDLKEIDGVEYQKIVRRESQFGKRFFYLCSNEDPNKIQLYAGDYPTKVTSDPLDGFAIEKSFGLGLKNGKWAVLTPENLKFTAFKYDKFDRVEEQQAYFHLIFCKENGKYSIVDEEGHEFYGAKKIDQIKPITCDVSARLMLYKDDKIALVDNPATESALKFDYEDVVCAEHGFYLKKGGKWGMIDEEGNVIEDFIHEDYSKIGK